MRGFNPTGHLRSLEQCPRVQVRDGKGSDLTGVTGRSGPQAVSFSGHALGLDEICMEPGTRFDMHEHEGDHILYVLEGEGAIWIGGSLYPLKQGDSVFVPAECPHGVTTAQGCDSVFKFLAFGIPHHPLDDDHRMRLVEAHEV